ncbi:MAG TPA: chemotaxis protein CheW [Burkholderiaceae bacterium]|nr:chemotaxis protein CheW [Burkholderiaceae bacterium]
MANREALRELQSRLASRLQAARNEGQSVSWLAVESGGKRYLFPLSQSGEIFPWGSVQAVPYTQPWFLGVANLRGGLFGVIDLAAFVSGGPSQQTQRTAPSDASLLALNAALEVNCALLVQRLSGLRGVEAFAASIEAPEGSPAYFGHVYVDAKGVHWQEINLQLLSQSSEFLSISA